MIIQNPALQAIYDKLVGPALKAQRRTVRGNITTVYYKDGRADVLYYERDSNVERVAKRLLLPRDADGVFRKSLESGDPVEVSFRNGSKSMPYISMVYPTGDRDQDLRCTSGSDHPRSYDLF